MRNVLGGLQSRIALTALLMPEAAEGIMSLQPAKPLSEHNHQPGHDCNDALELVLEAYHVEGGMAFQSNGDGSYSLYNQDPHTEPNSTIDTLQAQEWRDEMLHNAQHYQEVPASTSFFDTAAGWAETGITGKIQMPSAPVITWQALEQGIEMDSLLIANSAEEFGFAVEGSEQAFNVPRKTLEMALRRVAVNAELGGLPEVPKVIMVGNLDDNAYMLLKQNVIVICMGAFSAEPDNSLAVLLNKVGHEVGHKVDQHATGTEDEYKKLEKYMRESRADSLNMLLSGDYIGAAISFAKAAEVNFMNNDWDEAVMYDANSHPCDMQRMKMSIRLFAKDKTLSYQQRRAQYEKLEAFNSEFFPKFQEAGFELKKDLLQYYHDEYAAAYPEHGKSGAREQQHTLPTGIKLTNQIDISIAFQPSMAGNNNYIPSAKPKAAVALEV
jgi:hypothetical protein